MFKKILAAMAILLTPKGRKAVGKGVDTQGYFDRAFARTEKVLWVLTAIIIAVVILLLIFG